MPSLGARMCACLSCCCGGGGTDDVYAQAPGAEQGVSRWTARWRELVSSLNALVHTGLNGPHREDSVRDVLFTCILRLYSHTHVDDAIEQLYLAYDAAPSVVRFYIPQLLNFLLSAAPADARKLEVFLLDKCERSLFFAHSVAWFLTAYAPHTRYTSELCGAVAGDGVLHGASPLLRAVQVQGTLAALRMAREVRIAAASLPPAPAERATRRDVMQRYALAVARAEHERHRERAEPRRLEVSYGSISTAHTGAQCHAVGAGHASPLERAAALALVSGDSLASVTLRQDSAAHAHRRAARVHGAATDAGMSGDTSVRSGGSSSGRDPSGPASPVAVVPSTFGMEHAAVQRIYHNLRSAALVPASPVATVAVSTEDVRIEVHLPHAGAEKDPAASNGPSAMYSGSRMDALPTSASAAGSASGALAPVSDAYTGTLAIAAELTRISLQLMPAAPEARNAQLRLALGAVNAQFLPSSTAYVPAGNCHNRLVAIHPEHSFCFKTKARVPYMAVLEVVEYANVAGGPLEDSDSDDDDDTRDRAHTLREAASAAAASLGAQLPDKRGLYPSSAASERSTGGRSRSNTIGDAQDAAAAAVAAVSAAFVVGARQVTQGANAIKKFVASKVNEIRGRPQHRGPADAATMRRVRGLVSPVRRVGSRRVSSAVLSAAAAARVASTGTPPGRTAAAVGAPGSVGGTPDGAFHTPLSTVVDGAPAATSAAAAFMSPSTDAFVTPASATAAPADRARAASTAGLLAERTRSSSLSVHSDGSRIELPSHGHLLTSEEHRGLANVGRRSVSAADVAFGRRHDDDDDDNDAAETHARPRTTRGSRRSFGMRSLRSLQKRFMLSGTPSSLRKPLMDDGAAPRGRAASLDAPMHNDTVVVGIDGHALVDPLRPPAALSLAHVDSTLMLQQMGQWASSHGMVHHRGGDGDAEGSTFTSLDSSPAVDTPQLTGAYVPPQPRAGATGSATAAAAMDDTALVADAEFERELRAEDAHLQAMVGDIDSISELPRQSSDPAAGLRVAGAAVVAVSTVIGSDGVPASAAAVMTSGPASAASSTAAAVADAPKPVSVVFAERWRDKEARVAATSAYSHLPGWRLLPVIIKANDDLRQEQFVSQLMFQFAHIFRLARVPVWMRPYAILATSSSGGMIQAVPDTISIDALKRGDPHYTTMDAWFDRHYNFGARGAERVALARTNYVRSMAAYSIVCYLLNIKDRHNGNILLDRKGHVIHIDFGFLFTNSPGGNINFEAAPFKLTQEYVTVMGGPRSELFTLFRKLCVRAFLAARKYRARIILLVEMMLAGSPDLPCFRGGPRAVMGGLRSRFFEGASDRQAASYVHDLIDRSLDNWRTRWYDSYQRFAQGVF